MLNAQPLSAVYNIRVIRFENKEVFEALDSVIERIKDRSFFDSQT